MDLIATFMASIVYVVTAIAYIGIGVVVVGWFRHNRKNHHSPSK